jgi:hypothetical protein
LQRTMATAEPIARSHGYRSNRGRDCWRSILGLGPVRRSRP